METINDSKLRSELIEQNHIMEHFSLVEPQFLLLHYKPGELLTTPFSPSELLQFMVDGKLAMYDMPDEESTIMLETTYSEVSILGEMELLDSRFTPFFVEARTDVYTLAIHLSRYREILLEDPVFLRYLCRNFALKLNGAVSAAWQAPLRTRVLCALQHGEVGQSFGNVGSIAKSINVSERQLLRVLKQLCEEGLLEHPRKGTYVLLRKPKP